MIDIHPPAHGAMTRRDFFVHLGIVVLGILIAIGLEQAVEAVHHAHQRSELRESLQADAAKTVHDTENADLFAAGTTQWLDGVIDQVNDALDNHRPMADSLPLHIHDFDSPDDPAWKAARSSGLLELLSQKEIKAYSEADSVIAITEALHVQMNAGTGPIRQFWREFTHHGSSHPDLSHATPENLRRYRNLLIDYHDSIDIYRGWCHATHGAELAILHGERNLDAIQKAER
ncbi:MAG TPA: hypothetical protein VGM11_02365 [Acidobacteriaceae bacterium]|jgi:hypothetical protein